MLEGTAILDNDLDNDHHHHLYQQGQGTIQVGEPSSKTVVNIPIGDGGSFGELALIYGEVNGEW